MSKQSSARVPTFTPPLQLRTGGHAVDGELAAWIYDRTGRRLGKLASQIERTVVRFGDVHSEAGADTTCTVEVVLRSLPSVVVEEHGTTLREAFERAGARAAQLSQQTLARKSARPVRNRRALESEETLTPRLKTKSARAARARAEPSPIGANKRRRTGPKPRASR